MDMSVWRIVSGYQELLEMLDPQSKSDRATISMIRKEIKSLCSDLSDDICDEISSGARLH